MRSQTPQKFKNGWRVKVLRQGLLLKIVFSFHCVKVIVRNLSEHFALIADPFPGARTLVNHFNPARSQILGNFIIIIIIIIIITIIIVVIIILLLFFYFLFFINFSMLFIIVISRISISIRITVFNWNEFFNRNYVGFFNRNEL